MTIAYMKIGPEDKKGSETYILCSHLNHAVREGMKERKEVPQRRAPE